LTLYKLKFRNIVALSFGIVRSRTLHYRIWNFATLDLNL